MVIYIYVTYMLYIYNVILLVYIYELKNQPKDTWRTPPMVTTGDPTFYETYI
jgi:hypothetical protein